MKKSLIIGINNYNPPLGPLQGCENDAEDWDNILTEFGFQKIHPIIKNPNADYKTIKTQLINMMNQLKNDDDIGVVVFSGHGGWQNDKNGEESDLRDEIIITQNKVILDDEIYLIVSSRENKNSKVIFISDSCNSGDLIAALDYDDKIGQITGTAKDIIASKKEEFLNDENVKYLEEAIKIQKVKEYEVQLIKDLELNKVFLKNFHQEYHQFEIQNKQFIEVITEPAIEVADKFRNYIMISSCESWEVSKENTYEGKIQGLFSYLAKKIIRENQDTSLTYTDLVSKVSARIKEQYKGLQNPTIDGDVALQNELIFYNNINNNLEKLTTMNDPIFPQEISQVNTLVPLNLVTDLHDRCQIVHFDMCADTGFVLLAKVNRSEQTQRSAVFSDIDFSVVTAFNNVEAMRVHQIESVELLSVDDPRRTAHKDGDVDILVNLITTTEPEIPLKKVNLTTPIELLYDKAMHTTIYIDGVPLFDEGEGKNKNSGGGSCSSQGSLQNGGGGG